MKVAINTRFLIINKLEGIGRFTHEICKRLVNQHPEIEFHFLFDRPYNKKFIYGPNVIPHVLYPPARHPILWNLWFEHTVPWVLKKYKIDVFFSPDSYMSISTNVPTIIISHDISYVHFPNYIRTSHLRYYRKNFEIFHRKASYIGFVSEFTRRDVVKNFDLPNDNTFLCYNSCGDEFKPLSNFDKNSVKKQYSEGCDYFLFVGALHPRKNVVRLIKAFEIFKSTVETKTKLMIVGRWAWKNNEIRHAIENNPRSSEIIHLDAIYDISKIMAAAKALCYTSIFEGFGIPIIEAFQSEVPVITSNTSAMPEISGDAALIVDPFNVEEIANAMMKLDSNEKEVQKLIAKGKVQRNLFSWDISADSIFQRFKKIL